MESPAPLRWTDYLLVTFFCAVLFGYACVSGRPLTMHEARLPVTSREMMAKHNWLLPTSGNRPWLERPPLPHWIVIGAMKLFHHDDREWVVRLPSAVMGLLSVLLASWMAGRWLGRNVGILSGLILATSFEFHQYTSLAEDDIYLTMLVTGCIALFTRAELLTKPASIHPLKNRRWEVWAFFIMLGISNLTKGPLMGEIVVLPAIAIYLLINSARERSSTALLRWSWAWGAAILVVLTIAWPLWAYHKQPDVLANWKIDYGGRMSGEYAAINQKWYYYIIEALPSAMAPWTPACLVGLLASAAFAFGRDSQPPEESSNRKMLRLIWCWAIVPVIVLSIPQGKHHHYLLPILPAWAILGAIGAIEIAKFLLVRRGPDWLRDPLLGMCVIGIPGAVAIAWFHDLIPGPMICTLGLLVFWLVIVTLFFVSLHQLNAKLLTIICMLSLLVIYCWGLTFLAPSTDQTVNDTAFLKRVRAGEAKDHRLFINANLGPMGTLDFFRIQFYSRPDAVLIQNLSFLRDKQISDSAIYVIARAADQTKLEQLGKVELIDQSLRSHEITVPAGRFSLFSLTFDPNLKRWEAPHVSSAQAMGREPGPWCGPAL